MMKKEISNVAIPSTRYSIIMHERTRLRKIKQEFFANEAWDNLKEERDKMENYGICFTAQCRGVSPAKIKSTPGRRRDLLLPQQPVNRHVTKSGGHQKSQRSQTIPIHPVIPSKDGRVKDLEYSYRRICKDDTHTFRLLLQNQNHRMGAQKIKLSTTDYHSANEKHKNPSLPNQFPKKRAPFVPCSFAKRPIAPICPILRNTQQYQSNTNEMKSNYHAKPLVRKKSYKNNLSKLGSYSSTKSKIEHQNETKTNKTVENKNSAALEKEVCVDLKNFEKQKNHTNVVKHVNNTDTNVVKDINSNTGTNLKSSKTEIIAPLKETKLNGNNFINESVPLSVKDSTVANTRTKKSANDKVNDKNFIQRDSSTSDKTKYKHLQENIDDTVKDFDIKTTDIDQVDSPFEVTDDQVDSTFEVTELDNLDLSFSSIDSIKIDEKPESKCVNREECLDTNKEQPEPKCVNREECLDINKELLSDNLPEQDAGFYLVPDSSVLSRDPRRFSDVSELIDEHIKYFAADGVYKDDKEKRLTPLEIKNDVSSNSRTINNQHVNINILDVDEANEIDNKGKSFLLNELKEGSL